MDSGTTTKKKIGKTFEVDNKIFYPVVMISTIEGDSYFAESITPLAMIIVEPSKKYLLPLSDDELDYDEKLELFISNQYK